MADRRRRPSPRRVPLGPQVLLVLVLLVGLLWGLDALARVGAQSLLARNVQDSVGVEEPPQVRVHGTFFLPQVIRGRYDEVDVSTTGLTSGPLRVDRLDAQLRDVHLPFHDVLVRDVRAVGIGHSDEQVRLRYDDLNAYFDATGTPLRIRPAADGEVELTGTVAVLNQRIGVTTRVKISAADGQLTFVPASVGTDLPQSDAIRLLLAQRLRLTVPLGVLPFGQELTSVTPGPDGLDVTAAGDRVVLQP